MTTPIEVLLYDRLRTNAGVAAIVGDRVYPNVLPQMPVLPALRYVLVDRVEVLAKPSEAALRLMRARVQLDCYAATYSAAKALATAVKAVVYGWQDRPNGVLEARAVAERDLSGLEETVRRVSVDALISYNE